MAVAEQTNQLSSFVYISFAISIEIYSVRVKGSTTIQANI